MKWNGSDSQKPACFVRECICAAALIKRNEFNQIFAWQPSFKYEQMQCAVNNDKRKAFYEYRSKWNHFELQQTAWYKIDVTQWFLACIAKQSLWHSFLLSLLSRHRNRSNKSWKSICASFVCDRNRIESLISPCIELLCSIPHAISCTRWLCVEKENDPIEIRMQIADVAAPFQASLLHFICVSRGVALSAMRCVSKLKVRLNIIATKRKTKFYKWNLHELGFHDL